MKVIISIFYLFFGLFFNGLEMSDEIVTALKQGKSSDLVKYFDEKVSIKLINQEDVLSKSQAEANLKYFFEKHPVKNFSSSHVSSVNNSSQYITGTLETTNEKFRVSILIRRNLITQFRIETAND
jgi:ribosome biogenesis GTPase A